MPVGKVHGPGRWQNADSRMHFAGTARTNQVAVSAQTHLCPDPYYPCASLFYVFIDCVVFSRTLRYRLYIACCLIQSARRKGFYPATSYSRQPAAHRFLRARSLRTPDVGL
jgi:hypothetical protein